MSNEPIVFNNTVLRDGHQSLAATRMRTEQMLPALGLLDDLGFGALETWGGATIDACLRYLHENPFDRLSELKKGTPKTPHMMLLRGQNLVQYTSFPDDVVTAFVKCSVIRGMDIFRIFDALNDTRNLTVAIQAVHEAGKHAQGVICYTTSPVHTMDSFIRLGEELEEMGSDSVCVKDMAGLITPSASYELIKALKKRLKVPVVLHTHSTVGMGAAAYYAAIEAGAEAVDTSIAPFANGTGQPDTLLMQKMLDYSPRKPAYNEKKLHALRRHFDGVYEELSAFTSPSNERVDSDILVYQVPGGMLSNFRNQLKEQKMSDRLDQVMEEIPFVREQLGWIPLVTPTSQIVGTQAMLNVKFGPWKMLSQPAMDILLGKYGKTPGPVNAERRKQAEKQAGQNAIEGRPADFLEPRMPQLRKELTERDLPETDELAVLYAMFPQELVKVMKGPPPVAETPPQRTLVKEVPASVSGETSRYRMTVNGTAYEVAVEDRGNGERA